MLLHVFILLSFFQPPADLREKIVQLLERKREQIVIPENDSDLMEVILNTEKVYAVGFNSRGRRVYIITGKHYPDEVEGYELNASQFARLNSLYQIKLKQHQIRQTAKRQAIAKELDQL